MSRREKATHKKLNLIPILDSIFIFIFFLLMSAQFIEVYEIETKIPQVEMVKSDSKEKPLSLKVKILNGGITLYRGIASKKFKTYKYDQLDLLQKDLLEMKKERPIEKTITIDPHVSVDYEKVINVIDQVKVTSVDGEKNELFPNIVFK